MTCAECGALADERALRSRACRADLPAEAEAEDQSTADLPAGVAFCATCSAGELGYGSDW